jgi:hypothetical protein
MQIYIVHNLPQTQPITLEIKENATGLDIKIKIQGIYNIYIYIYIYIYINTHIHIYKTHVYTFI